MSKKQNTKAELAQGEADMIDCAISDTDESEAAMFPQPQAPICPNCGQWQHPADAGFRDCVNQCAARGLAPQRSCIYIASESADNEPQPQAPHSPLPAKWHDCEVAEKQIKLLQQQANQAQALAEAIGKIRTAMDRGLDLTPSIYGAIATLANWEGVK